MTRLQDPTLIPAVEGAGKGRFFRKLLVVWFAEFLRTSAADVVCVRVAGPFRCELVVCVAVRRAASAALVVCVPVRLTARAAEVVCAPVLVARRRESVRCRVPLSTRKDEVEWVAARDPERMESLVCVPVRRL